MAVAALVENVGQTLVCPALGQAKAYPTTHL
jgi:hypothetical protein